MALRRVSLALAAAVAWAPLAAAANTAPSDPSIMHGLGQVVRGVVVELPATVIDATMTGPLIVGTVVGLFAGTAKALQVTVAGLVEVGRGFDPLGSKKPR